MEEDGFYEVCVVINGSNTDNIATANIRFTEITAEEGEGIASYKLISIISIVTLFFRRLCEACNRSPALYTGHV